MTKLESSTAAYIHLSEEDRVKEEIRAVLYDKTSVRHGCLNSFKGKRQTDEAVESRAILGKYFPTRLPAIVYS